MLSISTHTITAAGRLGLILLFGLSAPAGVSSLHAQDTLRVLSYNVLNYPGSTSTQRNPLFRTVVRGIDPDIVTVQEMTSSAGTTQFRDQVLNAVWSGAFTAVPFNDGFDTDNAFYFRPTRVMFLSAAYITTALRDIAEYTVRIISTGDTLRIYSLHLKASTGSTNEQQRLAEATILRNHLNALPTGSKFIVLGDYNIYRSSEPAFQKLIGSEADNSGRCFDPQNVVGDWSNNAAFAAYHTQSPRVRSFDGGSTGGLDDRFDIFLVSDSMRSRIITSSITNYGNDGQHLNDSINHPPNLAVADSIADAIHGASDHLPVFADVVFTSPVTTPPAAPLLASPAPDATVPSTGTPLTWRATAGAQTYRVQLAGDSLFTTIAAAESLLTDTSWTTPALTPGDSYFWRVRASNAAGAGPDAAPRRLSASSTVSINLPVTDGWNLLSVPVGVPDARVNVLFPTAVSPAYAFRSDQGYVEYDSLEAGTGYWLKFAGGQNAVLTGTVSFDDTVAVSQGWNIVGSVSAAVDTASISTIPAGILDSEFYLFNGLYTPSAALQPGNAYWVKATEPGLLILRAQKGPLSLPPAPRP